MKSYLKKGLLEIVERESTHYSAKVAPKKPPQPTNPGKVKGSSKKSSNDVPPLQSSIITPDHLSEAKRAVSAKRPSKTREIKAFNKAQG